MMCVLDQFKVSLWLFPLQFSPTFPSCVCTSQQCKISSDNNYLYSVCVVRDLTEHCVGDSLHGGVH